MPDETEDVQSLKNFLADRDAPCPHCGYNLRSLASRTCPECGTDVELTVGSGKAESLWFIAAMMGFGGPTLHNGLAFAQYFKSLLDLTGGSSAPTIFVMAWYRGILLAAFGMLTVLSVYARVRRWSPRAIRRLLIVGGVVWVLSIGWYVWRGVR